MAVSSINQTQIEDPFEGTVQSFDNALNTRDLGARFLHPHVAEGVGSAAGDTFPLLDRTWNDFSSPSPEYPATANNLNLTRVDYMQVSHLQETVRQNESVSYYLETGADTVCPSESNATDYLDQTRHHLAATDNVIKIGIDVHPRSSHYRRSDQAAVHPEKALHQCVQQHRSSHSTHPRTGGRNRNGASLHS